MVSVDFPTRLLFHEICVMWACFVLDCHCQLAFEYLDLSIWNSERKCLFIVRFLHSTVDYHSFICCRK